MVNPLAFKMKHNLHAYTSLKVREMFRREKEGHLHSPVMGIRCFGNGCMNMACEYYIIHCGPIECRYRNGLNYHNGRR